ncbi:MAG: DMT family transporter [Deltaproteobacteria bacterium]
MANWLYLGLAALSGAAMAVEGSINAALGKIVGVMESTLLVHLIGTVVVLAIMIIMGTGWASAGKLGQVPWWAYLGGVLSVLIIYALVLAMPKVGVANATTAIIVAQISMAVLIDALGLFGMKRHSFNYYDLLGIALLVIGARILLME